MKCRARTADDVEKARRLSRFRDFFMQYSDEMAKGNISGDDLREILEKEYDVRVKVQ